VDPSGLENEEQPRGFPVWLQVLLWIAAFGVVFYFANSFRAQRAATADDFLFYFRNPGGSLERNTKDFEGRVVVVTLWATWCPYCRGELPALEQLARERSGDGVVVLTASDESDDLIQNYEGFRGTSQLVAMFSHTSPGQRRLPSSRPYTFVLDRKGRVVREIRGAVDFEVLNEAVAEALKAT
jgi:thiol-disulfide isomerase/thioredoxin